VGIAAKPDQKFAAGRIAKYICSANYTELLYQMLHPETTINLLLTVIYIA
jgi:hypothetical protein